MPKKSAEGSRKRTKSDVIVTPEVIIITLPPEESKRARERIRESGVAKFEIKEIQVRAIPSVRVATTPVHCP